MNGTVTISRNLQILPADKEKPTNRTIPFEQYIPRFTNSPLCTRSSSSSSPAHPSLHLEIAPEKNPKQLTPRYSLLMTFGKNASIGRIGSSVAIVK